MRSNGDDGSSMPGSVLRKITSREDGAAAAAVTDDDDGLRREWDDGREVTPAEQPAIRNSTSCTFSSIKRVRDAPPSPACRRVSMHPLHLVRPLTHVE